MKKFTISLLALLTVIGTAEAQLSTSYTVYNTPQFFLNKSISATETSIELAAPKRNGETVTFPVTSGGILRLKQGSKIEDIAFTGATIQSDSEVTLLGVTRDVCWNTANAFTSCNDGRSWSRGTIMELTVDARLLNFKADINRQNSFTGSGEIVCSATSQSCFDLGGVTTAQRDAFTYKNDGHIIWNSTVGAPEYYDGSSWLTFAATTGSIVNATESIRGVVEIAGTGSILNATALGSTGAENVLSARYTTAVGGVANIGKIPIIGSSGYIGVGMGGTGTGNIASGSILIGQGANTLKSIAPGSNGDVLTSNGTSWSSQEPKTSVICTVVSDSSDVTSGTYVAYNKSCTIGANTLAVGDVIVVETNFIFNAVDVNIKPRIGGQDIATFGPTVASSATIKWIGGVESIGASGVISIASILLSNSTATIPINHVQSSITLDTTNSLVIDFHGRKNTGGGTTNHIETILVTKYSQ